MLVGERCRRRRPKTKRWEAGAYSFSDELGGFRIAGVCGTGTKDDPIVITEELNSAVPVTLVIRTDASDPAVRLFAAATPTASCMCASRC